MCESVWELGECWCRTSQGGWDGVGQFVSGFSDSRHSDTMTREQEAQKTHQWIPHVRRGWKGFSCDCGGPELSCVLHIITWHSGTSNMGKGVSPVDFSPRFSQIVNCSLVVNTLHFLFLLYEYLILCFVLCLFYVFSIRNLSFSALYWCCNRTNFPNVWLIKALYSILVKTSTISQLKAFSFLWAWVTFSDPTDEHVALACIMEKHRCVKSQP